MLEFTNTHDFIKNEYNKILLGNCTKVMDNSVKKFITICLKDKKLDVQEILDFITSYAHGYFESGFTQGFLFKEQMIEDGKCI